MNAEYSLAMSEVLYIINKSEKIYQDKIPKSFIKFIEENADLTYKPSFNIEVPLKDLNLRKETKGLLGLIYRSYMCNEEEREEYDKLLKKNSDIIQKQLSEKYDVYKVFNDRQNKAFEKEEEFDNTQKSLIQYKKENIFIKIINKIKNIFKRR